ncbi:hypothetical protein [Noviherbaspirillum massiliense]|uniref:hypothetical protein n=1 Tax=Noviherbaspirillum massiliense TaxID=1465823 RepID=UPI0002F89807|nr:hypothetical protein [Noviherbaspirillum massiliense]
MFRAAFVVLVLCVSVSGCTQLQEIFLPPHEKVNKAFPPNAEVRIAEESLRARLQDNEAALKSFEEQYASRLQLRALTCSQGISIGRFDTVAKVKGLLSRECLSAQDGQLLQFLGIRQVALLIAQPPLRPKQPLGSPALVRSIANIYSGAAAANAGVAVLRGTSGEFASIEIPGGKKIASLPSLPEASHHVLLSPNGRVAAIQISNSRVAFIDTETGATLWNAKEITQFLAWLPEISAALANEQKNGSLVYVDFQKGKIEPHPIELRRQTWGLSVSSSPSRVLLGSQRAFSLVEHERAPEGIKGTAIKEFSIKQGQGVTSSPPILMREGKAIVFISSRDFMAVDLESGNEALWPTAEFLVNQYGKLGETTLLVDSYQAGGTGTKPWVFDIEKSTLSPVETREGNAGILAPLAGRTGYMRREYNGMWFGDMVQAGDAKPLDELLAAFNLERQLAKLKAQEEARAADAYNGSFRGMPAAAPSAPLSYGPASGPIADLAREAQVEAVGVYQGSSGAQSMAAGRRMGHVEVRIRRSAKPLVLVLSSYEPVRWSLISEPGAKLSAVMVSGYYPSDVVGAGTARVIRTGSSYAYKLDSPEYNALNRETIRWTGKGINVFQGGYEGRTFSVGG